MHTQTHTRCSDTQSHIQSFCLAMTATSFQVEDTCLPAQESVPGLSGPYMQEVNDQPLFPWVWAADWACLFYGTGNVRAGIYWRVDRLFRGYQLVNAGPWLETPLPVSQEWIFLDNVNVNMRRRGKRKRKTKRTPMTVPRYRWWIRKNFPLPFILHIQPVMCICPPEWSHYLLPGDWQKNTSLLIRISSGQACGGWREGLPHGRVLRFLSQNKTNHSNEQLYFT